MKEVVIKRRDLISLAPNQRWTFPDDIADQLIARGSAEEIKPDILEQEEKAAKKEKGGKSK